MFEHHHPFGLGDEDVGGSRQASKGFSSTTCSTQAPSERPGTASLCGWSVNGVANDAFEEMTEGLSGRIAAIDVKLDQMTAKLDACLEVALAKGDTTLLPTSHLPPLRSAAGADPPIGPPMPPTAPAPLATPAPLLSSPRPDGERLRSLSGIVSIPSSAMPDMSPTGSEKSITVTTRAAPRSSSRPHSGVSSSLPLPYRNSIIARRIYEKSASKNLDNIAKRIKALPQAMTSPRNACVQRVYEVLDDPSSSKWAHAVSTGLESMVLLSVLVTFLQTMDEPILYGVSATVLETIFECIYTMEVVLRFAVCPNRWNYFCTVYSWFDILAALPLILRATMGFAAPDAAEDSVLRTILWCFVPIFRLLKILRHFETFRLLVQAVKITFEALPMLLYSVVLVTMCFATLIYIVEPRDNIESPSRAVWFCIVTVTTVGYGDVTPTTSLGYIIVMLMIMVGVILMAVPIGIIGNTFNQVWNARDYTLLISRTRNALHKWGYTAHDIPMLFKLVDEDGNGVLDLDEFSELVKAMHIGLSQDRIIALFEHLDKDGSGALDAKEFACEIFPATYIEAYGHESGLAAGTDGADTA